MNDLTTIRRGKKLSTKHLADIIKETVNSLEKVIKELTKLTKLTEELTKLTENLRLSISVKDLAQRIVDILEEKGSLSLTDIKTELGVRTLDSIKPDVKDLIKKQVIEVSDSSTLGKRDGLVKGTLLKVIRKSTLKDEFTKALRKQYDSLLLKQPIPYVPIVDVRDILYSEFSIDEEYFKKLLRDLWVDRVIELISGGTPGKGDYIDIDGKNYSFFRFLD